MSTSNTDIRSSPRPSPSRLNFGLSCNTSAITAMWRCFGEPGGFPIHLHFSCTKMLVITVINPSNKSKMIGSSFASFVTDIDRLKSKDI